MAAKGPRGALSREYYVHALHYTLIFLTINPIPALMKKVQTAFTLNILAQMLPHKKGKPRQLLIASQAYQAFILLELFHAVCQKNLTIDFIAIAPFYTGSLLI